MLVIIVLLQAAILAVVLYTAWKARQIRRMVHWGNQRARAASVETTQQLEALDWLYRRLDFQRGSFPPTRGWAASPDFLNALYDQIAFRRPDWIVECGSGVTTIVAARCLQQLGGTGRVISLEHDPQFADRTRESLERLGLTSFVDLQVAPLAPYDIGDETYQWYDLEDAALPDRVDLIVVDGPPMPLAGEEGRYPVGPILFRRLTADGAALFDDAGRPGEARVIERLLREHTDMKRLDLPAEKGCALLSKGAPA